MRKQLLAILLTLSMVLALTPTAWMQETAAQELVTAYTETAIDSGTEEQPDNAELFAGYVAKVLYGDLIEDPHSFGAPAANRLTGVNAALYGKLKDFVSTIAENGGDTTITFTPEDLGITKKTFTNSELDMECPLLVTGADGKTTFAEGVIEAICLQMFDASAIFNALLADCPYELYWFDKANGWQTGIQVSSSSNNSVTVTQIIFTLYVFPDYAETNSDHTYDPGRMDSSISEKVAAVYEEPLTVLTCIPDTLTATYGQTLFELFLSGTVTAAGEENTPVEGFWAWEDSMASVGDVGSHTFTAIFIPDDTAVYDVVTGIEVTVIVSAKTIPSDVTLDEGSYPYTGSPITPAVTVRDGTDELIEGTDYTVAYENNTDAGTAKVTVTGKGNYTGSAVKNFTIEKATAPVPLAETENVYYDTATGTVTLPVPNVAGTLGDICYTITETADDGCILKDTPAVANGVLTYTLADGLTEDAAGKTAVITVNVSSANYNNYTVTVTITLMNKSSQEIPAVNHGYIPSPGSGSTVGSTGTPSAPSTPAASTPDTGAAISSQPEIIVRPEANVSGSVATVTVSEEMGRDLVDQAVESGSGTVAIAPIIPEGVDRAEVTIPASVAEDLAERASAELKVETTAADLSIPSSALSDLAQRGGDVSVSIEKTGDVISVELNVNDQPVSSVSGGVTAAVSQPDCTAGTVAMLVQPDGSTQVIRQSVADPSAGTVYVPLDGSAKVVLVDNSKSFSDVSASDWASEAVAFVSSRELMSGDGSGDFSPNASMTRSMLAVVLHNLENNPSGSVSAVFDDVSDDWYAEAIQWAAGQQIVTGYDDGRFGPDDSISREQLAVMLYRYADSPMVSGTTLSFSDTGSISDYASEAIAWAVSVGVMNGKGSGILDPQGGATRAEVAQMLLNFVSASVK
ncbi:MAG: hypothetical protein HDT16_13740 [Oscillibacter sp.]|nr:hypothetical protein [Oscillibacter sp.]